MAASQREAEGSGRGEAAKGCVEIRLKMKEFFQPYQFHGLHHPGIADHQEAGAGLVALLGQLHQCTQPGGIDEVDAAEVRCIRARKSESTITRASLPSPLWLAMNSLKCLSE